MRTVAIACDFCKEPAKESEAQVVYIGTEGKGAELDVCKVCLAKTPLAQAVAMMARKTRLL